MISYSQDLQYSGAWLVGLRIPQVAQIYSWESGGVAHATNIVNCRFWRNSAGCARADGFSCSGDFLVFIL